MGWIFLIIFDVVAIAWLVQALREFPRTNKVILDLQNRSRNLSLVERTMLDIKVKRSQTNFDASMTFFGVAIALNCLIGFVWLMTRVFI